MVDEGVMEMTLTMVSNKLLSTLNSKTIKMLTELTYPLNVISRRV